VQCSAVPRGAGLTQASRVVLSIPEPESACVALHSVQMQSACEIPWEHVGFVEVDQVVPVLDARTSEHGAHRVQVVALSAIGW
jgi:hypothetical protein